MKLVETRKEESYTICQYKIIDEKTLTAVKAYLSYDDEDKTVLQLGNVYIDLMYDNETSELMIGDVIDTESSSWELYPNQIKELFGSKYSKL